MVKLEIFAVPCADWHVIERYSNKLHDNIVHVHVCCSLDVKCFNCKFKQPMIKAYQYTCTINPFIQSPLQNRNPGMCSSWISVLLIITEDIYWVLDKMSELKNMMIIMIMMLSTKKELTEAICNKLQLWLECAVYFLNPPALSNN